MSNIKRHKAEYGKKLGSNEESIKKTMEASDIIKETKDYYYSLSMAEQAKVSLETLLENAKKNSGGVKTLADIKVVKAKNSDKTLPLNSFIKLLKQLNRHLTVIPNSNLGDINKAGHNIFFIKNNGLYSICGVGNACNFTIHPESKLGKRENNQETIEYRGYLAAIEMVISWLEKYHISWNKQAFK